MEHPQAPGERLAGRGRATTRPITPLVRFPRGEEVLPTVSFREEMFDTVDELLESGRCDHGRFEVETGERRLTCLIRHGKPYRAGLLEGEVHSAIPLHEFPVRAKELRPAFCRLVRSNATEVLIAAVHFSKRPALRGSVRFVDPSTVLEMLARDQKDAALSFIRDGARTLVFLHQGEPARLYFAEPDDDPGEGSLEERVLLHAFGADRGDGVVEVFTDLKIPPDPDTGSTLSELVAASSPAPPATVFVHMDGHEVRQRPFTAPSMVIGRDPKVDLFVDNLGVSRRHAMLSWKRGAFVVEDLGSSNGTFVDGERIDSHELRDGDEVRFGKFNLTVVRTAAEQQAPETMFVSREDLPNVMPTPRIEGIDGGASALLDRDLVIGRGRGVDLIARGWGVGPVHARVFPTETYGRATVECFGKGAVRVGGKKERRVDVGFEEVFRIGRSRFRMVVGGSGEE